MKLDYIYANPAGNITLLVTSPIAEALYSDIACRLFSLEPAAEQIGFIEQPVCGGDIRLHMSGGEFCGNASISIAACALYLSGRHSGTVRTEVFGIPETLKAELSCVTPSCYSGSIEMPLPLSISEKSFCFKGKTRQLPMVELPGISHIIFTGPPFEGAEDAVKKWCDELSVPALGLIFLDKDLRSLTPLVYVSSVNALYWEHSCASGTCSAAAWLAKASTSPLRFDFEEPGGILSAEVSDGILRLIGSVILEERCIEL